MAEIQKNFCQNQFRGHPVGSLLSLSRVFRKHFLHGPGWVGSKAKQVAVGNALLYYIMPGQIVAALPCWPVARLATRSAHRWGHSWSSLGRCNLSHHLGCQAQVISSMCSTKACHKAWPGKKWMAPSPRGCPMMPPFLELGGCNSGVAELEAAARQSDVKVLHREALHSFALSATLWRFMLEPSHVIFQQPPWERLIWVFRRVRPNF